MAIITLKTFDDDFNANLIAGKLKSEGIILNRHRIL
jgi:hypothetical protein